jgi:hypothetical protein
MNVTVQFVASVSVFCGSVSAQSIASRELGTPIREITTDFKAIGQIVWTSSGRVFINDPVTRRVVSFDTRLTSPAIVLDSSPSGVAAYGPSGALLSRFRGDSLVVYNRGSMTIVVLTPEGRVARTSAAFGVGNAAIRSLSFSSEHGLIWHRQVPALSRSLGPTKRPRSGEPPVEITQTDSSLVIGEQPGSRVLDTLRRLSTGQEIVRTVTASNDRATVRAALFPFVDEIAVMRDGTLAVFNSRDCRVEWVQQYRRSTSTRLPCEWRKVSDADRVRLADSVAAVRRVAYDRRYAEWVADSQAAVAAGKTGPTMLSTITGVDGATIRREVPVPPPSPPPAAQPQEIPDFLPATRRNAVYADADNRLWIRLERRVNSTAPYHVFDVIDRSGKLVDRVRIPKDRAIVGFAPGVIYLSDLVPGRLRLQALSLK